MRGIKPPKDMTVDLQNNRAMKQECCDFECYGSNK